LGGRQSVPSSSGYQQAAGGIQAKPETIIVHETAWTSSARHADIVLPATTTLERDDIGAADRDPLMIAMKKLLEPVGEARDDYEIFSEIARRLGKFEEFTENRTAGNGSPSFSRRTRAALVAGGHEAPDFETFWERGEICLPLKPDDGGPARAFRADPLASPLQTPSGKSRSFRRRSRASATTIAAAIRDGILQGKG
jgi:biotin/methionine sulfoxide reductase